MEKTQQSYLHGGLLLYVFLFKRNMRSISNRSGSLINDVHGSRLLQLRTISTRKDRAEDETMPLLRDETSLEKSEESRLRERIS